MAKTLHITLVIILLLTTSCVTNKKLNYFQESESLKEYPTYNPGKVNAYTLRSGDELYIEIKPLYEVTSILGQSSASSSQRISASNSYFYTYPVYENGAINYPYVGDIPVAGYTMEQARDSITNALNDYVQGMSITVKLANNYINILGEVKSPGRVNLTTEKVNLFEALALVGDLAPYGKRSEIKIIRETLDGPQIKTFDLRSKDIINSEYYWIQPGDIIYVSRIKGQFFKMDSFSDFLTIFSSSLSLILLTISLK